MLSGVICMAQDLIYKKDKTVLTVTIINIGTEEITYKDFNNPGPVLSISKADIIKIKTANGKEILMEQGSSTSFDSRNALKVDVFSLYYSKFSIAYEHSFKPNRAWEIQLGYIGIGRRDEYIYKLKGAFMRFGVKFKRSPEYYTNHGKSAHILKGAYIKPELVLGYFTEETRFYYPANGWYDPYSYYILSTPIAALMLNVGKQWTIGDALAIDYYLGLGAGFAPDQNGTYHYAFVGSNSIYGQTGLKLGVLF